MTSFSISRVAASGGPERQILNTLKTIDNKAAYYVNKKGELDGYSSINVIGRIWLSIKNLFDGHQTEKAASEKILQALKFVETNNKNIWIKEKEAGLPAYQFLGYSNIGYSTGSHEIFDGFILKSNTFRTYNLAAEKVIKKFPSERYELLTQVARRLIDKSYEHSVCK